MSVTKKILVISPHADDEVLGCGGYLIHQSANEDVRIRLIIGTVGGADKRQNHDVRESELMSVCEELGASCSVLFDNMDAMLDTIPSRDLTTALDKEIDGFRPDEIFINYRSRHQDHIKMYDCAMASLRLREGYRPSFIAFYEYPFIMNDPGFVGGGIAYHDITDVIDRKVKLFELYSSQIKKSPSPLNENGIKSLATIRGMECGCLYAEKFYIQKMTI